jgi:hypothetical protein
MQVMAEAQTSDSLLISATPPRWWAVIQITALAIHRPLTLLIGPSRAVANPVSALILSCLVALAAISTYFVAVRMRVSGWKALTWVSFGTLLFWHASGFGQSLPLPSWMWQVGLAVLVFAAAGRLAEHRWMKIGLLAGSLTLGGTIAINAAVVAVTTPPPVVGAQQTPAGFEFQTHPDIYLVILDGYARSDVIERIFDYDNALFEASLAEFGVDVYSRAKANYPITHFSIPSLLNMSYMHRGQGPISNADLSQLARSISGDNETVRTVKANGYRYLHGETISQYNHCGDEVDLCLHGPFLDVTMYRLLQNTPVGGLFYADTDDPATWLNIQRIAQMRHWKSLESDFGDGPKFTFLHLILPHPPLFLDRDCNLRIDPDLRGSEMIRDDIPADRHGKRLAAWLEQVECANRATLDFIAQLDDDDVVIVTSDHGSDATYRLFGDVSQYTEDDLGERIPTFTAARLPGHCRNIVPEDVALVNLFRYVFACLADETPDPLPDHTYVASFGGYIFEVKSPD